MQTGAFITHTVESSTTCDKLRSFIAPPRNFCLRSVWKHSKMALLTMRREPWNGLQSCGWRHSRPLTRSRWTKLRAVFATLLRPGQFRSGSALACRLFWISRTCSLHPSRSHSMNCKRICNTHRRRSQKTWISAGHLRQRATNTHVRNEHRLSFRTSTTGHVTTISPPCYVKNPPWCPILSSEAFQISTTS
jgi:hypothetical protein